MTYQVKVLIGCCLLLMAQVLWAETVYVTDILQLSMHEEERSGGRLLRNLPSGTPLQLLGRSGNYSNVRTEDGVEGWTKSLFLMTEKPARLQLADLESQRDSLETELESARRQLGETEQLTSSLKEKLDRITQDAHKGSLVAAQLREEHAELQERLAEKEKTRMIPLNWSLYAVLGSLVLGFIGGIAWFDYRSRKRHGGYRIY